MSNKKVFIGALFLAVCADAWSQASTNSPYTRYGLGDMSEPVFANNAAMGGVGYALRTDQHINPMNPASYTAVDSLSFMFDTGMTLKSSNFQEGNYKSNAKNGSFDYLAMQFRLHPRVGVAIGYIPFSTVGYNFSRTKEIEGSDVTISNNFYGDGGLQQIFGGLGFKILDNLSVGANIAYLYGKMNYQTTASLSNGGDQTIIYNQTSVSSYNANFGLQYTQQLDKNNSLTLRPKLSLQDNHSWNTLDGTNLLNGVASDQVTSNSTKDAFAYNAGLDLTYRHRFGKEGRTLSAMFGGTWSNNSSDTYTDYLNRLYDTQQEDGYSQYKKAAVKQQSYRGNLMFTEKLWDKFQLQTNYKFSYADNSSETKTYNKSTVTDLYDQLDESLSNVYQTGYSTHAGNVGLRYHAGKLNAMIGADVQWSDLSGDLTYPNPDRMNNSYFSFLPSFNLRYSLDRTNSFMLRYRSSSSSPSVTELQNVIDNSNPLFLSTGNPDLDQQISHTANLRYIRTTKSGHTFIAMVGGTAKLGYVADSTFVAKEDMVISDNVTLSKGSQFTKPVNMDGYYSLQSMLTYGFPFDLIRSNINFSVSANYSNVPTIFNGEKSKTNELNIIPKVIIGSNISQNLDFTASYSAGINKIYSSQNTANGTGDYITHNAAAKLGWTFFWGLTFRSTFNYVGYTGLDTGNEDYFLWNVSLGKKFLKNNAAEIKVEAFDILKQNQAFTHSTGSNYYDYINSNVLKPYAMISFVYTIR